MAVMSYETYTTKSHGLAHKTFTTDEDLSSGDENKIKFNKIRLQ